MSGKTEQVVIVALAYFVLVCQGEPYAKVVIRAMDKDISNHVDWNDYITWSALMAKFFSQDMIYDTNYFDGTDTYLGNGTGIRR